MVMDLILFSDEGYCHKTNNSYDPYTYTGSRKYVGILYILYMYTYVFRTFGLRFNLRGVDRVESLIWSFRPIVKVSHKYETDIRGP